jgi:hypothetical protein
LLPFWRNGLDLWLVFFDRYTSKESLVIRIGGKEYRGNNEKIFYVEISYQTMGWLNLGDDIWALYPQIWPTEFLW